MTNDEINKIILFDNVRKNLFVYDLSDIYEKIYKFEIEVPTIKQIEDYLEQDKKDKYIVNFLKEDKKISDSVKKIKLILSKVDIRLPLYDVYTENLYLVRRNNIYNSVINKYYRFPSKELLENLDTRKDEIEIELINMKDEKDYNKIEEIEIGEQTSNFDITKIDESLYQKFQNKRMLERKRKKITMTLKFMDSFDIETLYNTYVHAFYFYSNEFGKDLTLCVRPSFSYHFKHIKPYYTRSEIIHIALNMGLIKEDDTIYNPKKIDNLCQRIKENDIDADILLQHQTHIIKNKMIGLVQYYSMHGSYFMNQYLRGMASHNYKDTYLESLIEPMWKLVESAPEFDESYIVYRFIDNDDFISELKEGGVYTEKGFMSTTRDPFYLNDSYKFGWILLKIKLPAKKKGTALCIETHSAFPKEQEIILPPNTMIKLLRKDDKSIYYHIDKSAGKKMGTMYEFEVVGHGNIDFPEREIFKTGNKVVDFLKIDKIESFTIGEKIQQFISQYVDPMGLFRIAIGEDIYHVKSEWYDSSSVYKNFYAKTTKDGYSIYSLHDNHLLFMIEVGEQHGVPYIYANYYVKYSTVERNDIVNSENFINFLASVAYYFDVPSVYLYTDYISCDYIKKIDIDKKLAKFGGTFCNDFYEYLKNGKRKYANLGILNIEIMPKFKFHQLDILKKIIPDEVIKRTGENNTDDRIYQIYDKTYRNYVPEINNNLANFYIWMIENNCFLIDELISKFHKIPQYHNENPFKHDYYIFDACAYLFNRNKIKVIPRNSTNVQADIHIKPKGYFERYDPTSLNTVRTQRMRNEYRLEKQIETK